MQCGEGDHKTERYKSCGHLYTNRMFLEKRKAGKRTKYYVVHSFRDGKKVVKLRRYIGTDLPPEKLRKAREKAESFIRAQLREYREIRNPLTQTLSDTEIEQIKKLQHKIRIYHLDERQWQRFTQAFSYDTNAIEGSTVTRKEVTAIMEGKTPDKGSDEIAETRNVVAAVKHIRKTENLLSLALIKKIHWICFKDTKDFAGKFREKGVEVLIRDINGNVVHTGAPAEKIGSLLRKMVIWYNENRHKYPPILLAALIHNQFEDIHPFQDGNGRVGRLLLNNILLKHDLPPVNIHFKNRTEYYKALRAFDKDGNVRPMIELIVKEYKKLQRDIRG